MTINKEWHLQNKMPKNPTAEERLKWHVAHAKNCACRPLTKEFLDNLKKKIR